MGNLPGFLCGSVAAFRQVYMHSKRIAITGIGIFCAAGNNVHSFADALLHGKSAIGPVDLFDVSPFPSHIGAQIRGYEPLDHFDRRNAARLSRTDQFAAIAAGEALEISGARGHYSPYEMGVCMGGGAAGMLSGEEWLKETLEGRKPHPSYLRGILADSTGTALAAMYGLAGYQGSVTTACMPRKYEG